MSAFITFVWMNHVICRSTVNHKYFTSKEDPSSGDTTAVMVTLSIPIYRGRFQIWAVLMLRYTSGTIRALQLRLHILSASPQRLHLYHRLNIHQSGQRCLLPFQRFQAANEEEEEKDKASKPRPRPLKVCAALPPSQVLAVACATHTHVSMH